MQTKSGEAQRSNAELRGQSPSWGKGIENINLPTNPHPSLPFNPTNQMTRKKRLALRAEEKRKQAHHLREFGRACARSDSITFYTGFRFVWTKPRKRKYTETPQTK